MPPAGRQVICGLIWAWSAANLVLACFVYVIWQNLRSQVLNSACNLDPYYTTSIRPDQAYGGSAFHWTILMVYAYLGISIFIYATWTALAVTSFVRWKQGKPAGDASMGKTIERIEMLWWTAVLFVLTVLLTVMCWTVTYNRSANAFLFCDFKSGCCAENCDAQLSHKYLAGCNFPNPKCPWSAGASPLAFGCTAYDFETMAPLSAVWNYTGGVPGSVYSFNDYSAGYSVGLGSLQWGLLGLLVYAWCLLIVLMTATDTHKLAFASRAFNVNSVATAVTKKAAAAGIAPMLSSPNHPIHQLLTHIPSVMPAINAGQHAGVALTAFFRSCSAV